MAGDEPRRSVRATRGQHSKIDLDQAPPPKQTKAPKKSKKAQKAQEQQDDEDDDGPMRCICGANTEEDKQPWIACDQCKAWQHNACMGVSEYEEEQPDHYYCEECKPENHKELLDAVAKGEQLWKERYAEYLKRKQEDEKRKKDQKQSTGRGRRGRRGKRTSDPASRGRHKGSEPAPTVTPDPKPKQQETKTTPKAEPKPEPKPAKKEKEKEKAKEQDEKASEKDVKKPKAESEKPMEEKDTAKPVKEKAREEKPKEKEKPKAKESDAPKDAEKEKTAERKEPEKEKPTLKSSSRAQKRKEPHDGDPKVQASEPKLRKGPEGQAVPSSPADAQIPALLSLAEDRHGAAKVLIKTMAYCIKSNPVGGRADGTATQAQGEKLALEIEAAVFNSHPNHNSYAQQCRTLAHNLKHNQELCNRLLKGELTPAALSIMTSAEMQTKEQQQKEAEMLARAAKQATLSNDATGPRIRRTHKGEEIIDDDNAIMEDAPTTTATFRRASVKDSSNNGQPLHVETHPHSRKGSDFDFKKVMSSVSPTSASYRRPSQPMGPGEDADVDRMIGESPPYSPVAEQDPDRIWEGKVGMQSLADYFAEAKWAAGCDPTKSVPGTKWEQLIPHEMVVGGRTDSPVANTYLCSLRFSNFDVSVVTLTPSYPAGKEDHQAIIDYLLSKNRFAVITNRAPTTDAFRVVDFYLAACPAGSADEPEFLLNLAENIVPKDRPEPLLIAVLVLDPAQHLIPPNDSDGTAALKTDASQPGPSQASAAPNGQGPASGQAATDQTKKGPADAAKAADERQKLALGQQVAREVLGPELFDTPTLKFLLPMAGKMNRSEWQIVKSIYESEPRAREDLSHLNAAIEKQAKERAEAEAAAAQQQQQQQQQQQAASS